MYMLMTAYINHFLQPLPGLHVLPLDMQYQSKGEEDEHRDKRSEEDGRTLAELDGLFILIVLGGIFVEEHVLELLVEQHDGWMGFWLRFGEVLMLGGLAYYCCCY